MRKDFILDTERFHRQGFPEAIYTSGKTEKQVIDIISKLVKKPVPIIATRVEKKLALKIIKTFKPSGAVRYHEKAKIVSINPMKITGKNYIAVITAGTSDIPVAEESAVVAEVLGNKVERIYDVGVAGIHRVFKFEKIIQNSSCAVVCAGMEGALSSVIGGLVAKVVIGVPTSTGYGTGKGGFSALLTMLNSCSPNVCTVNIDNGFGAGIIANIINKNGSHR
ncbi:MAG: nickel pincer cofactor biosynthesis protein LarB [Elusimicrobia bacterium]|nr:nickel pincer cofactor biosynthesis protein LarB [Elusimicrobiota bacterium]